MNWKHLAKGDGRNKAGKKVGKGTTSTKRKLQRLHLQPHQPGENSWERDDGWRVRDAWDEEEEEEQEGGRKRRPPTPPKPKGRGRSRSSSNSSRGSRGSDVSMASSSRSRGQR